MSVHEVKVVVVSQMSSIRVFFSSLFLITQVYANQAYAEENRSLKIATYIEPPFTQIVDNKFTGQNIEIAKLLASSINLEPVFIRCPFARCMSMIEHGDADMIIALRKTAEREKFLTYLTPPYHTQHFPLRFYTLANSNISIERYEDLANLTIGTLRATTYFDRFDHDASLNKVNVTEFEQLINMLKKQRIDTFLEREESVLALMTKEEYDTTFKLAKFQYDNAVDVYAAMSKNSPKLKYLEQLSDNLEQFIQDGTIKALLKR
ncbi:substrate-binding periplasmic protein [Colwelliaceae bacterium 6471]